MSALQFYRELSRHCKDQDIKMYLHCLVKMCAHVQREVKSRVRCIVHVNRLNWGFSSSSSSFTGPVPVVLQGSTGVPGELWPLCNVTTSTEQPPWSDLSGVCQVSHLSHHPLTWPPITPPHSYRRGGERDALADPLTGSTNHRDPCGFTTQRFLL